MCSKKKYDSKVRESVSTLEKVFKSPCLFQTNSSSECHAQNEFEVLCKDLKDNLVEFYEVYGEEQYVEYVFDIIAEIYQPFKQSVIDCIIENEKKTGNLSIRSIADNNELQKRILKVIIAFVEKALPRSEKKEDNSSFKYLIFSTTLPLAAYEEDYLLLKFVKLADLFPDITKDLLLSLSKFSCEKLVKPLSILFENNRLSKKDKSAIISPIATGQNIVSIFDHSNEVGNKLLFEFVKNDEVGLRQKLTLTEEIISKDYILDPEVFQKINSSVNSEIERCLTEVELHHLRYRPIDDKLQKKIKILREQFLKEISRIEVSNKCNFVISLFKDENSTQQANDILVEFVENDEINSELKCRLLKNLAKSDFIEKIDKATLEKLSETIYTSTDVKLLESFRVLLKTLELVIPPSKLALEKYLKKLHQDPFTQSQNKRNPLAGCYDSFTKAVERAKRKLTIFH